MCGIPCTAKEGRSYLRTDVGTACMHWTCRNFQLRYMIWPKDPWVKPQLHKYLQIFEHHVAVKVKTSGFVFVQKARVGGVLISFVYRNSPTYSIITFRKVWHNSNFAQVAIECVYIYIYMSLMKQQFVVTHRYTILQKTYKTWQIINRPPLEHVTFLRKCKEKQFFVDTTLWQEVCL
jgi:hypothetical protein